MKPLQSFLAACTLAAPLYAAGVSVMADGEVGIPDWQRLKLLGR